MLGLVVRTTYSLMELLSHPKGSKIVLPNCHQQGFSMSSHLPTFVTQLPHAGWQDRKVVAPPFVEQSALVHTFRGVFQGHHTSLDAVKTTLN